MPDGQHLTLTHSSSMKYFKTGVFKLFQLKGPIITCVRYIINIFTYFDFRDMS